MISGGGWGGGRCYQITEVTELTATSKSRKTRISRETQLRSGNLEKKSLGLLLVIIFKLYFRQIAGD